MNGLGEALVTSDQTSTPGWVYDADSGYCRGPASYELAERYMANGGQPITINYHGCPQRVRVHQVPEEAFHLGEQIT